MSCEMLAVVRIAMAEADSEAMMAPASLAALEVWLIRQYGSVLVEKGCRWHNANGSYDGPEYVIFRVPAADMRVTVAPRYGVRIDGPGGFRQEAAIRTAFGDLARALATERLVAAVANEAVVTEDEVVGQYRVLTVRV